MDKYEYKVRAEEIKTLISEGEFAEAVQIADSVDWRRVKSVMMLCTISDLYKINRRFQESKDILLMAYERHPGGRLIVYSLCELSVKMGEFVQAIEYYKEFVQIAPKDTSRYILQYKLYEAQDVSLEERIAVLEEFKKRDYREKWAYELAYLYHRVGLETKCVEECDEMILWFGEGRHVVKALELKALHQPLSAHQKMKYNELKRQRDEQLAAVKRLKEAEAEEEEAEEAEEVSEEAAEYERIQREEGQGDQVFVEAELRPGKTSHEQELDFHVKPVDVGQYNTINLQKELAKSMKELLYEEPGSQDDHEFNPITETILAPLMQETEDMGEASGQIEAIVQDKIVHPFGGKETAAEQKEKVISIPAQLSSTEEVFFEDVRDVLTEDTKEIPIREREPAIEDTKEIKVPKKVIYPEGSSMNPSGDIISQRENVLTPAESAAASTVHTMHGGRNPAETQQPEVQEEPAVYVSHVLRKIAGDNGNTGFEKMLSQEYDGQIKLVVPDRTQVEKQITGQMNILDIMTEWEKMKRENEEKRREDVRMRVKQHTGNLFDEFDEAARTGLLEQLEKAAAESKDKKVNTVTIKESDVTDFEQELESIEVEPEGMTAEAEVEAGQAAGAVTASTAAVIAGMLPREEAVSGLEATSDETADSPEAAAPVQQESLQQNTSGQELPRRGILKGLSSGGAPSIEPEGGLEVVEEGNEEQSEQIKEAIEDAIRSRPLTDEEKELFGKYTQTKKAREQIVFAVDSMSMDAFSDNVIITGEMGAGALEVAKGLIRILQMSDSNFSGKVAKISGNTLNKKDVSATLQKMADGAVIIEQAPEMMQKTAEELYKTLSLYSRGLFVVLIGSKDKMNQFMNKNHIMNSNFNSRIDIEALNDHALVEYAKQYAREQEYSIDELGILALHTRIADMQTSDHEVTIEEVKELVDDAIYFADKKNIKHLFDILFGKRYDDEDMIILTENDFMHY